MGENGSKLFWQVSNDSISKKIHAVCVKRKLFLNLFSF